MVGKFDLKESYIYRMDYNSKTVPVLRAIAKTRGITGYSRLRKDDLVSLLLSYDAKRKTENLIDYPIPNINVQLLYQLHMMQLSLRKLYLIEY